MTTQTTRMMQQLFQFTFSDKLIQIIPQTSAILGSVTMVSMVLTIEISVSLFKVSHHLIGPFEETLIFNLFQDLVHGLSEYSSDYLIVT